MAVTCTSAPQAKACRQLNNVLPDKWKYVQDLLDRASNNAAQAGSLAACPDAALLPHTLQHVLPGLVERYGMGRELGRGHFGLVRECEEIATGEVFACKTMYWSSLRRPQDVSELRAEICTMLLLQSPQQPLCTQTTELLAPELPPDVLSSSDPAGLLQLHDLCCDSEGIHVIMERCNGGDFFDHIARRKCIPETEAAGLFRQLVLAARHMHQRGIVHRDLKPENILVQTSPSGTGDVITLKIADFGLALHLPDGQLGRGIAGSPFYMAPEVIRNRAYREAVDVWSLGVVLFVALSGALPFYGKNHNAVFASVCRAQPDMTRRPWPLLSSEVCHLIRRMLCPDPTERITLEEVIAHPWLADNRCPIVNRRSFNLQPVGTAELWPSSPNPASPVSEPKGGNQVHPVPPWTPEQQLGCDVWAQTGSLDQVVETGGNGGKESGIADSEAAEAAAATETAEGAAEGRVAAGVARSVGVLALPHLLPLDSPDAPAPVVPVAPGGPEVSAQPLTPTQDGWAIEDEVPAFAPAFPVTPTPDESPLVHTAVTAPSPTGGEESAEGCEDQFGTRGRRAVIPQLHPPPSEATTAGAQGTSETTLQTSAAPFESILHPPSATPAVDVQRQRQGQGEYGAVMGGGIVPVSCIDMHSPPSPGGCSLHSAQPSGKSDGIISTSTSCTSSSSSSSSSYCSSEDTASVPSPSPSFFFSPIHFKAGREAQDIQPLFHFPFGL